MPISTLFFLGAIVALAHTVEAMSGFGSTVISVTLGAQVLPVSQLLAVLVPLNVLMSLYFAWNYRTHIDRKLLLAGILPWMGAGVMGGIVALPFLSGPLLKQGLGALVVLFSLRQLWGLLRGVQTQVLPRWQTAFWLVMSGITHGVYASGGPLLVYALSGTAVDKTTLRSTLSMVWLTLNTLLVITYVSRGQITLNTLQSSLWLLPTLPAGIALGEWLHHKVNERQFRIGVFALLVLAGGALLRG
jgi:uncharacterized membrane protein YfcA